ncbi:hypothetical protein NDU88_003820 [Pleurodeles waltl]|uniref:Uncharacterized protein n=1 Tax=Pleurodeles waltl TaxID=8319 RepID=A0AAV7SH60_PLEWA|nr:hypothetical protein NDU88_003820 [Pleurodeles waltl]
MKTATDPPYVVAQTDPDAPDPEGEGPSTNPLRLPGAEGQSQQLCILSGIKLETATEKGTNVEGSHKESPENAMEKTMTGSTPEWSRGAISIVRGAGQRHGDPQSSSTGGAQREFQPRFRRSVSFPGAEEQISVGVITALGEDLIIGTDYEDFVPLLTKASQEYLTNTWWEDAPYATDPPHVVAQTDPAIPGPEGEGPSTNPLRLPGAKGQSQQLRALSGVKPDTATEKGTNVEGSHTESPEIAVEKTTGSTPERSLGAISIAGRAGQRHRDPQSSTSSVGGAQREFQPRFRRSVAFPRV